LFALVAAGIVLGFVFAGSPSKIADGVTVDGVDVGGLEASDARAFLEQKAAALAQQPVVFVAAGRRFPIRPVELGVRQDWKAAVDDARRQGYGFAPLRGFKRLGVDFFGADVTPSTSVLSGVLTYELQQIAQRVDRTARDARLVRLGLEVRVLPAQPGVQLDRTAAAQAIVSGLVHDEQLDAPEGAWAWRRGDGTVVALNFSDAPVDVGRTPRAPARLRDRGRLGVPVHQ